MVGADCCASSVTCHGGVVRRGEEQLLEVLQNLMDVPHPSVAFTGHLHAAIG
jgi:predicted phosphodiesterase